MGPFIPNRLLALLLTLSVWLPVATPLAAALVDHQCQCCPKGKCQCHRRAGVAGRDERLFQQQVCTDWCGSAGVPTTRVIAVNPPHAAVQSHDSGEPARVRFAFGVAGSVVSESHRQRPPPARPS
jgi:hypothetical protein